MRSLCRRAHVDHVGNMVAAMSASGRIIQLPDSMQGNIRAALLDAAAAVASDLGSGSTLDV